MCFNSLMRSALILEVGRYSCTHQGLSLLPISLQTLAAGCKKQTDSLSLMGSLLFILKTPGPSHLCVFKSPYMTGYFQSGPLVGLRSVNLPFLSGFAKTCGGDFNLLPWHLLGRDSNLNMTLFLFLHGHSPLLQRLPFNPFGLPLHP